MVRACLDGLEDVIGSVVFPLEAGVLDINLLLAYQTLLYVLRTSLPMWAQVTEMHN